MDKQRQIIKNLLDEANAALLQGQYPLAVTIADGILAQKPDYPQGFSIKFKALVQNGQYEQARAMGLRAAALNPSSEYILNNQACLEIDAGQPGRAIRLLISLLDQYGDRPSWLYNLGLAYHGSGQTDNAIKVFGQVLDCKPDHDKAAFQLVACLLEDGQIENAVFRQNYLRLLRSTHAPTHSQFINLAIKTGQLSAAELQQEVRLWEKRFIPEGQSYSIQPSSETEQLTIGFLVGDIPSTWLSQIVAPLVNALAKGGDRVIVYTGTREIPPTFFQPKVTQVASTELADLDFITKVRGDRLEVLVDVCGFNLGERQISLGIQVADRQYGWLAHPGYYASDKVKIMDKEQDNWPLFIQLPDSQPDSQAKLLANNTLAAIGCKQGLSDIVIRTWAEILKRQINTKLHLDATKPSIIENIRQRFADLGVSEDRLSFSGEYQFNHETVVVDNFMQNDIVEVVMAAKSGACVIVLEGQLFPSKLSAQLIRQLGRPEWISSDRINYVAKVIQLLNEQLKSPVTEAEIKNSGLQDLNEFVGRFRKALLP